MTNVQQNSIDPERAAVGCDRSQAGPRLVTGLNGAPAYSDRRAQWSGEMRITPEVLKCVVFICREQLIERETRIVPVATGFLVSMEPSPNVIVHYIITCRHVIETDPTSRLYIRVNTSANKSRNISTEASSWYLHDTADIAIRPFLKEDDFQIRSVHHPSHFIGANYTFTTVHPQPKSTPVNYVHTVQTGDEVAAIGLFIENYGEAFNLPIARFGHIARMPTMVNTPRWRNDDFRSVAFLAEFLAYPGLSGSPVFWFAEVVKSKRFPSGMEASEMRLIPALVGCVNGYVGRPEPANVEGDILGRITTQINTGIATVTPAAAIEELLRTPELAAHREEAVTRATQHASYVTPAQLLQIGAIHEPCFGRPALTQHETPATLTAQSNPPPSPESGPRPGDVAAL